MFVQRTEIIREHPDKKRNAVDTVHGSCSGRRINEVSEQ